MAPIHDGWKDDAEFLRYNQPEKPSFKEKLWEWAFLTAVFGGGALLIILGFAAAINDAQRSCYRGTARSYDSESPNARLIDVELDYSRRHPECQADWTPAKRREAERYWRYTDTLDQADKILRGEQ
jgi:hypothetical protein